MAHVLFISWWWPYPANNGSKLRIYNLLRGLSREHRVSLLSFAEPDEGALDQVEHLRRFCVHVEALPKPHYHPGALKATLGYLSRWPRSLVDVYSPAMAARVAGLTRSHRVDVLIASQIQTMRYLEAAPHIPAILEEMEVTTFHDRVTGAASRATQFRAQLTLTKLESALRGLLEKGAAMTVVSEAERDLMQRFAPPGAVIEVVPNGVDTKAYTPDAAAQPQPFSAIYTGAVTYQANLDAVRYFAQEVLPLVRARAPEATFTVTGGTGRVDVSALGALPGVRFTGYLPQVAPAVQASQVVVAPLRIGGGTRLKILEAMALGVPVVATRKGAEGLAVHDGEDILIADTPPAMADAVCRLFEDAALRRRLAAAGRRLVEAEYDWSKISGRLLALIQQAQGRTNRVHQQA